MERKTNKRSNRRWIDISDGQRDRQTEGWMDGIIGGTGKRMNEQA
jgi:hypothetical protein